jgi:bifunctional UDP-N-acetylglucosamine pyrophosphorylase/glucosamine-1-phosphate N-acetyltransferase
MQAVILAAGAGTRLEPVTMTMSKGMVPLANKPMLEWIIETARAAADKVFIVVRKDQTDIITYFKNRQDVEFIYQDKPLGTAHALLQAKGRVKGDFILMNGDILTTPENVAKLAELPAPVIAGFPMPNPQDFGVLSIDGNKAVEINEKPAKPKSDIINAGIYKLNDSIFELIERLGKTARGEYELTDALNDIMPLNCHILSGWAHLTYPWDILEANRFVLDNWGKQIGSADIRPGAYIEQPVAIGDRAVIGPNCYIRAYSSIGQGCKIGNAVEIKNSIIMPNTFVSHLSYVGDSIIGRNCNIAAGTIFANLRLDDKTVKMQIKGKVIDSGRRKLGALVGDGVRFGVNCTVMPGRRIWPSLKIPPCTIIKNDVTKQPSLKSWKRILA